jgi:hypothetical protein
LPVEWIYVFYKTLAIERIYRIDSLLFILETWYVLFEVENNFYVLLRWSSYFQGLMKNFFLGMENPGV